MPDAPPPPLATPLTELRGIGSERSAQLARLGLHTIGELLLHRPRRYEDRRQFAAIADLEVGVPVTTRGTVVAQGVKRFAKGAKSVFELILSDGSTRLHCRWWNLPYMERYFKVGDEVFVHGKPLSLKPRTIDHPETEVIETGDEDSIHLNRIVPVYPLTEGLPQRWLRGLLYRMLGWHVADVTEPRPEIPKPGFPSRRDAVQTLHFPPELAAAELARRRLALDEFIELQISLQTRRRNLESRARGLPCAGNNQIVKPFLARLGFTLTGAQAKVLRAIRADLGSGLPMRRLLQGDVGSGKTVVAACSALMAIESGYSAAIMAPTEILAGQHYRNFSRWLQPLGVPVELVTGAQKTASPKEANRSSRQTSLALPGNRPAARYPTLWVGTHALVESAFSPENLGLVVIDEQHKFGVGQRERLVRKGRYPHLLVMTATPIPRTLGLTLYGDLDVSVIDQLPGGRGSIKTFVRAADKLPKVWAFIKEKLAEGRQAYVVYPLIEESDLRELKSVTVEHEKLRKEFAGFQVGLLHGRLSQEEKDAVMTAFRECKTQLLVATSVIEVGVDVPNATVMVIENADRFGLAQLHQLRGRIGRGAHDSYCVLVAEAKTDEARDRLKVMEETSDGFKIAEADLALRGPGEFLGKNQSGLPDFQFGDLVRDRDIVEIARDCAKVYLQNQVGPQRAGNSEPAAKIK
ncbi:MAG TPA: ATP-dependent DNA helicase RecG [Verrucomicrobiae bacterium]|nr:ATP-dependent DNA helicase RecG [Verrucomicrobiae bacterium]